MILQDGARAFMIEDGDNFKEIWLTSQVVSGLLKLNKKNPCEQFDLVFLKASLVGLCTIKKIKEENSIEVGKQALIQHLFECRTQKDETRKRAFGKMFETAIDDLRQNKFK